MRLLRRAPRASAFADRRVAEILRRLHHRPGKPSEAKPPPKRFSELPRKSPKCPNRRPAAPPRPKTARAQRRRTPLALLALGSGSRSPCPWRAPSSSSAAAPPSVERMKNTAGIARHIDRRLLEHPAAVHHHEEIPKLLNNSADRRSRPSKCPSAQRCSSSPACAIGRRARRNRFPFGSSATGASPAS
jgi:hypothetical protein